MDSKTGDVLEDNTVVGYPTLLIPDINTKEGTKQWCNFKANPNAGFQFVWYGLACAYEVWYGALHLGEIVHSTDKRWVGRWGRNFDSSPYYESPLQAAQWLLANGIRWTGEYPPTGP
jgi:hypothetical protein